MARILVAVHMDGVPCERRAQWIDVDDAADIHKRIAAMCRAAASDSRLARKPGETHDWSVLAYDGLPDFGAQPELDELLAYLDAADDYGEPFEKLWASRRFVSVIEAADAFANTYQGTYVDAGDWARHYLDQMGTTTGPAFDFDAYGRAAAARGDVEFIAAESGGIHVFWND